MIPQLIITDNWWTNFPVWLHPENFPVWFHNSEAVTPQDGRMKNSTADQGSLAKLKKKKMNLLLHTLLPLWISYESKKTSIKLIPKKTSFVIFQPCNTSIKLLRCKRYRAVHKYTDMPQMQSLQHYIGLYIRRRISHMAWFYLLFLVEILRFTHVLLEDSMDRTVLYANLISGKKVFL